MYLEQVQNTGLCLSKHSMVGSFHLDKGGNAVEWITDYDVLQAQGFILPDFDDLQLLLTNPRTVGADVVRLLHKMVNEGYSASTVFAKKEGAEWQLLTTFDLKPVSLDPETSAALFIFLGRVTTSIAGRMRSFETGSRVNIPAGKCPFLTLQPHTALLIYSTPVDPKQATALPKEFQLSGTEVAVQKDYLNL